MLGLEAEEIEPAALISAILHAPRSTCSGSAASAPM